MAGSFVTVVLELGSRGAIRLGKDSEGRTCCADADLPRLTAQFQSELPDQFGAHTDIREQVK